MFKIGGILSLFCALAPTAFSQVFITGENGGKNSNSLLVVSSLSFPKEALMTPNFFVQYGRGVASHLDVFLAVGDQTSGGISQQYLGIGENIGLLSRKVLGVDLSFYNFATFPVTERDLASTSTVLLAPVASRPFKVQKTTLTVYGGFVSLVPAGQTRDKFFTYPNTVYTGAIGVNVPVTKSWSVMLELDPGATQRAAGMAASALWPPAGQ
jgi:hypothetical protein